MYFSRATPPVSNKRATVVAASFLSLCAPLGWAQIDTAAEAVTRELLRQQEREQLVREQQEQVPDLRFEAPRRQEVDDSIPAGETPCFNIDSIALTGEMADAFQWALHAAHRRDDGRPDPATGRCLGARGVGILMKRVQNAIVDKGYVTTRVLAEPQDLRSGALRFTLIPGRVRSIRLADAAHARANLINALPIAAGDVLNLRDLEQALENLKRVPTAEADIKIVPAEGAGAKPGESDLVIDWRQDFPFRLNLSVDDGGTKATGKYQGALTISYDHWFTLNDLFYVSLNHDLGGGDRGSRGTRGGTIHYSLPLSYWLLGLTASDNTYHQSVAGASQIYRYSGESSNAEVRLSRVIYRDAVRKTTLSLGAWMRRSRNYIDDTEILVQRRRMAGWDASLAHREFVGRGTLDVNLGVRHGTGMLDALPAPEEAFGEGTSQPRIVNAGARLSLPFELAGRHFRYTGAWRAQWDRTPLVPQDRFSIGGRYTVRGFDGERALSAERGWLVRNEIGWMPGQLPLELYLGADFGQVGGPSAGMLAGRRLAGAVLGLRGDFHGVAFDAFIGKPLKKPSGFQAESTTAGFSLNWSF